MSKSLSCWQCGASLTDVIFPMSRREVCTECAADQHVCKMCKEFDGCAHCNEPRADDVSDREKANFCDYFSPSGQIFTKGHKSKADAAKSKLAELFGEVPEDAGKSKHDEQLSPAELAEQKLRQLLGD